MEPTVRAAVRGPDGVPRCPWAGDDPLYVRYHDEEWGRPVTDETRVFEKLCLEGFQAGLAWITILRKREAFRAAFDGFDAARMARYGDADVARLLADAGIVRHRSKIEAAIGNARALVALHAAGGSLAELVWSHAPATPGPAPRSMADVPAQTAESAALSRALKAHGFRFVGPTTAYAAMQALGVVDDHLAGCTARGAR
ncbi:MAG: DNA-3-methyladenine glycosylase I [Actinobacteria bacterium]|nr:DNA-3-methyladenine glycosylase I [Actinomycetota bacterium]